MDHLKLGCVYSGLRLLVALYLLQLCTRTNAAVVPTEVTTPTSLSLSEGHCGPWFKWNETEKKCECVKNLFKGIIKCDNKSSTASVLDCYCATIDDETNKAVAGSCFYNYENNDKVLHDVLYHNISDDVCEDFNRTGTLCGKCINGTYPLAYSFDLKCVTCDDDRANWAWFIVVATVPSTIFFLVVIIFKINLTSSYLHGFVLFSQGISFLANMRIILRADSYLKGSLSGIYYLTQPL